MLDPLMAVVNLGGTGVGGRFVSGDHWGFVRYAKIDKKEDKQNWKGIIDVATRTIEGAEFGQSANGNIFGASYGLAGGNKKADPPRKGKPTFVLTGSQVHRQDFDVTKPEVIHSIIMASHDGEHWDTVVDRVTLLLPATALLFSDLVWDKDANKGNGSFFCKTVQQPELTEGCYQSADGYSWTAGGGKFEDHCKGVHREKGPPDLKGQPDGLYGYDKSKDLLIWPESGSGGVKIKKKTKDGKGYTEESMSIGTDFGATCVAFVGGIWEVGGDIPIAGGPQNTAATYTSTDDGKTWQQVSKGALGMHEETGQAPGIQVIVGAPRGNFPQQKRS
jgi:hypothetical protein